MLFRSAPQGTNTHTEKKKLRVCLAMFSSGEKQATMRGRGSASKGHGAPKRDQQYPRGVENPERAFVPYTGAPTDAPGERADFQPGSKYETPQSKGRQPNQNDLVNQSGGRNFTAGPAEARTSTPRRRCIGMPTPIHSRCGLRFYARRTRSSDKLS